MSDEQKKQPQDSQATESEQQLAELKSQCDEYLNGWKRAKADYQNLQKETEGKFKELASFVKSDLVSDLIPILDNFSKAVEHIPEEQKNQAWVVGVFHIKKQLEDFLVANGLEKIKVIGEKFNPEFHEAVGSEAGEKDIVIREVSSGYKLNGKVIIPVKVIVGE